MAILKYSMGGPITSIRDQDSVEKREEVIPVDEQATLVILCNKCGIQHMISAIEQRICCGSIIKTDQLS